MVRVNHVVVDQSPLSGRGYWLLWTNKGRISRDHPYLTIATSYSYGEGQNWGYQNSKTPEPIVTKFGMGDYVGDMTQQAKIQPIAPVEASWQMGEISLSCGF